MAYLEESESNRKAADGIRRILEAGGLDRGDRRALEKVLRNITAKAAHERDRLKREIREGAARAAEVPDHLFDVEWNDKAVEVRHSFETGHSVFVNPITGVLAKIKAHEPGLGLVVDAVKGELNRCLLRGASIEDDVAGPGLVRCESGFLPDHSNAPWVRIHEDEAAFLHQGHGGINTWLGVFVSPGFSTNECAEEASKCLARAMRTCIGGHSLKHGKTTLEPGFGAVGMEVEWVVSSRGSIAFFDPRNETWWRILANKKVEDDSTPESISAFILRRIKMSLSEGEPHGEPGYSRKGKTPGERKRHWWNRLGG